MTQSIEIGFLIYPDMTQLYATGPAQVLSRVPGARIRLIAKSNDPVPTDAGFSILPTDTLTAFPPIDVLCIPGGPGQLSVMQDPDYLSFVREVGATARYVTSVCSGSLVLGAAGLLQGYRAACHWAYRERLVAFGAIPTASRVVRDRNRITGGGVTAVTLPRRPNPV